MHEDVKIKVSRPRKGKLGDFRPSDDHENHVITVNDNLNPYSFLITFVHEVAHLKIWERHKNKVDPHGAEWKQEFKKLMRDFMTPAILPESLITALSIHFTKTKSSTCFDPDLMHELLKYDVNNTKILLSNVEMNVPFEFDNRVFIRKENLRTRSKCEELNTNRVYLIHNAAFVRVKEEL